MFFDCTVLKGTGSDRKKDNLCFSGTQQVTILFAAPLFAMLKTFHFG